MSERIVKNVGSGLLAQAWTALLGLIALPILVRGLGAERYGLLALSLALIGFAAVADLGVGRAASKFIAEDYERNEVVRTQKFVRTALTVSATMGILGTAVLLLLTPLLVKHVFTIREPMQAQATLAFVLTAVGLMPVLLRILFDGVLAGHHRIAFLSAGNMIANTLKIGLSVAAIVSGYSVLAIVAVNVLVCYLHAGGLWWYTRRHFAGQLQIGFGWDREIARQLLTLGVVSTVSWVFANVIFLYADRFLIGIFFPLSLIGYYTMAFDITSKQWYISGSVSQAFFPVFSGKSVASPGDLEAKLLTSHEGSGGNGYGSDHAAGRAGTRTGHLLDQPRIRRQQHASPGLAGGRNPAFLLCDHSVHRNHRRGSATGRLCQDFRRRHGHTFRRQPVVASLVGNRGHRAGIRCGLWVCLCRVHLVGQPKHGESFYPLLIVAVLSGPVDVRDLHRCSLLVRAAGRRFTTSSLWCWPSFSPTLPTWACVS